MHKYSQILLLTLLHLKCKIRLETEQNGSERSGTDTQHAVQSVSTRFLLNYEAKRWSKAKYFLYQWNRHLQAELAISLVRPQAMKTMRNNRFYTAELKHFSQLFIEVRPGQSGSDPHSVLSVFKGAARSRTCYSRFNHHPAQSSCLNFNRHQYVLLPAFLITEEGAVLSRTLVVVRITSPAGFGLLIRR
jgi:hypothetical protein